MRGPWRLAATTTTAETVAVNDAPVSQTEDTVSGGGQVDREEVQPDSEESALDYFQRLAAEDWIPFDRDGIPKTPAPAGFFYLPPYAIPCIAYAAASISADTGLGVDSRAKLLLTGVVLF